MRFAHFSCLEDRDELDRAGCFFYRRASSGLFTFDQTGDSSDFKAEFACRFDGLNRGRAGRAHVIDDHYSCTYFVKSLDALSSTVSFFLFAHQKSVNQEFAYVDRLWARRRSGLHLLRSEHGNRTHDWIGSHRESADRFRLPPFVLNQIQENASRKTHSFGIECSGAAIDVVVAGAAGGELELSQLERLTRKQVQK